MISRLTIYDQEAGQMMGMMDRWTNECMNQQNRCIGKQGHPPPFPFFKLCGWGTKFSPK